jgi:transposase
VTRSDPLPADLAAAHAMILAERTARCAAEARAEDAEAQISGARLEIERLKLLLAKARREQYGQSSEHEAKIIAQLELQLAELEETVAQEETAAEMAAPAGHAPRSMSKRKPARRPALEAAQPIDLPPSKITARPGAPWIPGGDVAAFMLERLGA